VETLPVLSLFLIGLSYGSSACLFSCMPFLSPIIFGRSESIRASMGVLVPFSLGRIFSYSLIAMVSAYSSHLIKAFLDDTRMVEMVLGSFTILIALYIIRGQGEKKSCCTASGYDAKETLSYFMMGSMISFNLCMPVVTLITASAYASSPASALLYGLSFGTGAVAASFLLFGVVVSMIAKGVLGEFARHKRAIEIAAGVLLLIVGVFTLLGWVKL